MAIINVDGAAARLLANKTLAAAGYCLHYCWLAISQGVVHYITGGAGSAYATWLAVPEDHQHSSRNVPKDFPAFLGPKLLSKAGDVILSNGTYTASGELQFVASDWPRARQVGLCTLAQREKQTGRHYEGWASSMGGHELVSSSLAGETGSPITADAPPPSRTDTDMRFARVTLNASGNHYMGYLIGPDGIIDQIDNQEGWDGKTAFADNAIYARYETLYGAGLNRADYTFTPDQWTAMQTRIGGWAKSAGGVTNVTVDNTTVLDAIKALPVPPRAFTAQ